MAEKTPRDNAGNTLLTIPGELRNHIWELLFESSEVEGAANLGLLLVCRQTYTETRGIAFAATGFVINNSTGQTMRPVFRGLGYTVKNLKLRLSVNDISDWCNHQNLAYSTTNFKMDSDRLLKHLGNGSAFSTIQIDLSSFNIRNMSSRYRSM
ncbi:hypothetical protein K402DRAFT_451669 [Aulographum hederae CBS 113979]|uniref:Uncharacterized protein n=1 Tax=Aulographum hederae CBS 113979 TaxID=1176131 RepID=A0A6G1HAW1_9PEZI|nr:hypothetical protein K402DRAFT_451669 [Aulographum hederae CBS 113979]